MDRPPRNQGEYGRGRGRGSGGQRLKGLSAAGSLMALDTGHEIAPCTNRLHKHNYNHDTQQTLLVKLLTSTWLRLSSHFVLP